MSVQLSEFTARLFNMTGVKPLNVRRCLFGRPDPEKLSQDFEKLEKIQYEEDARRFRENWSFDPVTGPIEGGKFQYEVIAVDASCGNNNVPCFYTKDYTARKPKHVRIIRDRSVGSFNESSRLNSAKRKLDLDWQENDENEILNKRVPNKGDIINDLQMNNNMASSCSPASEDDEENNTCSRLLCDSPAGLTRYSSTQSSLPDSSPTSRNRDIMTPPSRPRSLVQSTMKDYLANKKHRLFNTKALPRT